MTNLVCNWEDKMRYYNNSMNDPNNRNRLRKSRLNRSKMDEY